MRISVIPHALKILAAFHGKSHFSPPWNFLILAAIEAQRMGYHSLFGDVTIIAPRAFRIRAISLRAF